MKSIAPAVAHAAARGMRPTAIMPSASSTIAQMLNTLSGARKPASRAARSGYQHREAGHDRLHGRRILERRRTADRGDHTQDQRTEAGADDSDRDAQREEFRERSVAARGRIDDRHDQRLNERREEQNEREEDPGDARHRARDGEHRRDLFALLVGGSAAMAGLAASWAGSVCSSACRMAARAAGSRRFQQARDQESPPPDRSLPQPCEPVPGAMTMSMTLARPPRRSSEA